METKPDPLVSHVQLTPALPRDEATLGPNPLPAEVQNVYWRLAQWSADRTEAQIRETVDHWSCALFQVPYRHLTSIHDRGRVFVKMNERLRDGCAIDGPNIHIGNIFGR